MARHLAQRLKFHQLRAAGEIDLIVGRLYAPDTPDGFVREALYHEPISILARAGHPIFDHGTVTVEDLRRFDLVLPTVSQRVGREIEGIMAALGMGQTASLRASSPSFTREMLHTADFITIIPRLMLAGDLLRGTIRVVPLPIPAAPRPAGLIYRADRGLPPTARVLVEVLRDHLAELAEGGILPIGASYSSP
jgi:LysR family transcriptional regulator, pca operon transcriptional activator